MVAAKSSVALLNVLAGSAVGMIAVQVFDYRLGPTMTFVLCCAFVMGYLSGRIYGLMLSLQAALLGSAGALAFTVIGLLFFSSDKIAFVVDVLYIVLLALIYKILERQLAKHQQQSRNRKGERPRIRKLSVLLTGILGMVVVVFAFVIVMNQHRISVGQIGLKKTQQAVYDEKNNLQVAEITVNQTGFNPRNTDFATGTMVKAVLRVEPEAGNNLRLISKDLNIDAPLKQGDNLFVFNKPLPGVYRFSLSDGRFEGTFTVK